MLYLSHESGTLKTFWFSSAEPMRVRRDRNRIGSADPFQKSVNVPKTKKNKNKKRGDFHARGGFLENKKTKKCLVRGGSTKKRKKRKRTKTKRKNKKRVPYKKVKATASPGDREPIGRGQKTSTKRYLTRYQKKMLSRQQHRAVQPYLYIGPRRPGVNHLF